MKKWIKNNLIFFGTVSISLPVVFSLSCRNNSSAKTDFDNDMNKLENEKSYAIEINETKLTEEVNQIQNLAANNKLLFNGQPLVDAENKIPILPAKIADFTADYLVARKLISFKFTNEEFSQKYDWKISDFYEDRFKPILKIEIWNKTNSFYKKRIVIEITGTINYGQKHNHMAYNEIKNRDLTINEAYWYNLDQNGNYKN